MYYCKLNLLISVSYKNYINTFLKIGPFDSHSNNKLFKKDYSVFFFTSLLLDIIDNEIFETLLIFSELSLIQRIRGVCFFNFFKTIILTLIIYKTICANVALISAC